MMATSLKYTVRGWVNPFKVYLYSGDFVMPVKELRVFSYVRYALFICVFVLHDVYNDLAATSTSAKMLRFAVRPKMLIFTDLDFG